MDYKKYSLENLENWLHDAMSAGEAKPQEIYDVIVGVVKENYYTYKQKTSEAYELLALLNGNGKGHIKEYDDCVDKILSCDKDDSSLDCNDLHHKTDRVVKWQLPVEVDGLSGECYVNFPDDLLEAANFKEGDTVQWIDNADGTYLLKKV